MQSTAEGKLFETLFNHASIGIIVVNSAAEITLVNQFALFQFGYESSAELKGKKIEVLIPGRFHGKHVAQRDGYIHKPNNRPMGIGLDLFGKKNDGSEFPVEVSLGN